MSVTVNLLGVPVTIPQVNDANWGGYLTTTLLQYVTAINSEAGGITALTGDVTASGPGSAATTIAKIQGTTVSGTIGTGNVVFSNSQRS